MASHHHGCAAQGNPEQLDALLKRLRCVSSTLEAAEVLLAAGRNDEISFARAVTVIGISSWDLKDLRDALAALEATDSSLRKCG